MNHSQRMGHGRIVPLLFKFSIPATLGTLMNATYNIVDRMFIGQAVESAAQTGELGVGPTGLAALAVSFPVMMVMIAFGMKIGFGTTTLISVSLGEKKQEQAEKLLSQGVLLFTLLAVAFMAFGLAFLEPMLRLFGASEAVLPHAKAYLSIIILGVFVQEISFGVNSFIRGEGNPTAAMITMFLGCGTNIVLDWLFISQWGWGIRGAAWATVTAQTLGAAWVLFYYLSGRSTIRLRWKFFRIYPALAGRVFVLGFPMFFMNVAGCVAHGFMNNQLQRYGGPAGGGDDAVAVMGGVIMAITMVVLMPIIGLSQGAQPLIGYNYGAKRYDRVLRTFQSAMIVATMVCVAAFCVIQLFPRALFAPFCQADSPLLEMGVHAIRRYLLLLPGIGVMIIASNYFLATKRPGTCLFLSVTRQALLLIPMMIILPRYWELDGVWLSGPISDFGALIVTSIFVVLEFGRLNRLHEANGAEESLEAAPVDSWGETPV